MDFSEILITKRDGKQEVFSIEKIKNAVTKSFRASSISDSEREMYEISFAVANEIKKPTIKWFLHFIVYVHICYSQGVRKFVYLI